jgi:DNA-binding response OmpR family regulator
LIKILVVEDEKAISDLIRLHLTSAGYHCACRDNGMDGADAIESGNFDLVLLDIMLPGVDGYELMEYIRPLGIPVIFVTAKHEVKDRVKGLKLGADDYLVKPFDIIELLARVETVLRRSNKLAKSVAIDGVTVDFNARSVMKGGKNVELTAKEYGLLELFVNNRNIALFRETLYEKVWGSDYLGDSRTVDLHVQRLRRKLGWEDILTTVHKVGYRLNV